MILAVDTSQIQASLSLIDKDQATASLVGSTSVSHSESILPHVDQILKDQNIKVNELTAFAAGVGPGSFTGIRIGLATLKAFAQVNSKPMIAFSSLRAQFLSTEKTQRENLIAMVNAYQGLVFAGFENAQGVFEECAIRAEDFCKKLDPKKTYRFSGNGAKLYFEDIKKVLSDRATLVEPFTITPVGMTEAVVENKTKLVDAQAVGAQYLRPSQAELNLEKALLKPRK